MNDEDGTRERQRVDDDVATRLTRGCSEDAALIARVTQRHHEAMAEIYERHGSASLRAARQVCGDDLADDVVQDVFLQLWERPEAFDPSRGPLRAYLLMKTKGRSIDVLRSGSARRNREHGGSPLSSSNRTLDDTGDVGDDSDTWDLLRQLPAEQRHAIALAYFGGYTYREVAVLLRQPVGTIKGRIRSGLAHLRALLPDDADL